uniref:thioredoxin-dependent peroxiredoxin n=1 Tax=Roseihalotalea indica TaxID=2867963 RepID=A0AA49JJE4_9BACT|nr:peroxiredoxin-like family protein [Tunicatimonas sp. TK19036]
MTPLSEELSELTGSVQRETSPKLQHVIHQFIESLRRQNAAEHSVQLGDHVDDFLLKDQHHRPVRLYEQLERGPVVLVFFRGGWCPYCNLTLRAWRYAWPDIEFVGGKLLALTPENPSHVQQTVQKNSVDFPVLHDIHSEVARHFGISVVLSNYMSAFYRSLGMNTSLRNADVVARLPLPATYIIDQQATVQYVFVEEDYTRRAEITDVLQALSHVPQEMVPSYG